ncbi:O-antigen ligase family protein [Nodosilinea sp. LEGE 07088]|uniref:O-antigen ligase family protein n=1 Tax=Nodosilinea sp. LEGE 07088 TaxID=2777968 RepID=UPI00187F3114|nr:O-antigen ligase [Nodosilinea sp. LEGE 07088]MBE9137703.1 O-antigen ligase family protein [Nodosilinea sp. LEGE 07088]
MRIFQRLEYGFTVFALFLYTSSILALVLSRGAVTQGETVNFNSSLILLIFSLTYLVIGILVICRWKKFLRSLRGEFVILPILAFAGLSYFWSDAPDVTLRRLVAITGTSLFGLYLGSRYSIRQQLHLLACSFGLIVLISLAFVIALPSYGISSGLHEGAWRGVFIHKNGLGISMVTSATVFGLLAVGEKERRWLYWMAFFTSVALMLMAQSGTAIVTLSVVLLALPVYRIFTLKGSLKITWSLLAMLTVLTIPIGLVWANPEQFLALIGEDATLTGRTTIWAIVIDTISQRPILGYGYEAFWRGLSGPSAVLYYVDQITAAHSHNGILELWTGLGFAGVVIFVSGLWLNFLRAITYLHSDTSAESYWPAAYLTTMVLVNIAESNILQYNELKWVLYAAVSISLAKWITARKDMARGHITDAGSTVNPI